MNKTKVFIATISILITWFLCGSIRNWQIETSLEAQKNLSKEVLFIAEQQPLVFKKNFTNAFNAIAGDSDFITKDSGFKYRQYSDQYSYSGAKKHDYNKDGFLSVIEIERWTRKTKLSPSFMQNPYGFRSYVQQLLAFDLDGDGKTTRSELVKGIKKQIYQLCPFPNIPTNAEVIFIGIQEGNLPSAVSVSGPHQITKISDIHISDISTPIVIVATSRKPIIWRFGGHTENVIMITTGNKSTNQEYRKMNYPNVGVVGLKSRQITFVNKGCLRTLLDTREKPMQKWISYNGQRIARNPSKIITKFSGHNTCLPQQIKCPNNVTPFSRAQRNRLLLAGKFKTLQRDIQRLDKETVLSPSTPSYYLPLPEQFGLAQLLEANILERLSCSSFLLKAPIGHLPAGLTSGPDRTSFILAPNVKKPDTLPLLGQKQITRQCPFGKYLCLKPKNTGCSTMHFSFTAQ